MYLILTILSLRINKDKPSVWGYKTPAALRNDLTWQYANSFAKRYQFISFIMFFVLSVLFILLIPSKSLTLSSIVLTVISISIIPVTEIYLSKKFNKQGELKKPSHEKD